MYIIMQLLMGFLPNMGIVFSTVLYIDVTENPLYIKEICDKMGENSGMRIDIMNRNTIISLAMLYALWQSNRQDLLDLIRPFVLYSVGNTTKVGDD